MNKLPVAKRVQILFMLCEGSSMRSISRVADVSINTVVKLLVDAGRACTAFHDERVRGLRCRRIQCDEIWAFCYSKARNVPTARAAPEGAGDAWTWSSLCADSKLICNWMVGGRDAYVAMLLMDDLKERLTTASNSPLTDIAPISKRSKAPAVPTLTTRCSSSSAAPRQKARRCVTRQPNA